jgi:hypothetical protein
MEIQLQHEEIKIATAIDGKHCKFESKIVQQNLCGAFENRSKTIALQAIHLQMIAGVFLVHLPELDRIVSHAPLSVDNSR